MPSQDLVSKFATFTLADAAGGAAAPSPAASAPPPPPPPTPAATAATSGRSVAPARAATAPGDRVVASPYAKKLAAEAGVSLAGVAGSGPGGRIVEADVKQLLASGGARPAGAAAGAAMPAPGAGGYTDLEVSQIKRVTAARCGGRGHREQPRALPGHAFQAPGGGLLGRAAAPGAHATTGKGLGCQGLTNWRAATQATGEQDHHPPLLPDHGVRSGRPAQAAQPGEDALLACVRRGPC